jgi:hypothetical protein
MRQTRMNTRFNSIILNLSLYVFIVVLGAKKAGGV